MPGKEREMPMAAGKAAGLQVSRMDKQSSRDM